MVRRAPATYFAGAVSAKTGSHDRVATRIARLRTLILHETIVGRDRGGCVQVTSYVMAESQNPFDMAGAAAPEADSLAAPAATEPEAAAAPALDAAVFAAPAVPEGDVPTGAGPAGPTIPTPGKVQSLQRRLEKESTIAASIIARCVQRVTMRG